MSRQQSQNKTVILYDFLLVKGGAEAVALDLCEHIEGLDLAVGFVDRTLFTDALLADALPTNSRLHTLTSFTGLSGWQILKSALAFTFKGQRFKDYDKVIYSGGSAPLAVSFRRDKLPGRGSEILYCHTPPRFIYDLKAYYLSSSSLLNRSLIKLLIAYLQPRYEAAVADMDLIIANSINIQQRLKRYLNVDSVVIYPPCHIDRYHWLGQGDYYLSTARVEGYKRVDLIVKAFMQLPDKKLVVASGGSQLASLQKLAEGVDNITFTGWCEPQRLSDLMGHCIATLYLPLDEDFGISPVESMAAGKPVIGVREGGVMETVVDGLTGVLCPARPEVADIVAAVEALPAEKALQMQQACQQRAALFSKSRFIDKMRQVIDCPPGQLATVAAQVDASREPL